MTVDTSKIDRVAQRLEIASEEKRIRAIYDERDKIEKPFDVEIAEIERRRDAALEKFDADNSTDGDWPNELTIDCDGYPERCCVTDLVLFDNDELVEDSDGRKALRAAIPNWPRGE